MCHDVDHVDKDGEDDDDDDGDDGDDGDQMYMCASVHVYVRACVWLCVYVYMCMHACDYVCTCVYVCVPKTLSWTLNWGSSEPLEASGGQTKQTVVGVIVVYGILEQVGSAQRAQK